MVRNFTRSEVVDRLNKTISEGMPILVACCGAGLIAKCAARAGADIVMTACTSKSRLMGLPTYPMGNINSDMMELFPEIYNVVKDTPIIASLEAQDPRTLDISDLVGQAQNVGYSGILNYPTLSPLLGHERRLVRESVGLGFGREVEMMEEARQKELFTIAYAFNPEDAELMAKVPVDCLVAHVGTTGGGIVGSKTGSLEEAAHWASKILRAAKAVNEKILFLAHGGPFVGPEQTEYLYQHTDAVGFVGASSIERVPIEEAVQDVVARFKSIPLKK